MPEITFKNGTYATSDKNEIKILDSFLEKEVSAIQDFLSFVSNDENFVKYELAQNNEDFQRGKITVRVYFKDGYLDHKFKLRNKHK